MRARWYFGGLVLALLSGATPALAAASARQEVPRASGQLSVHIQQLLPNGVNQLLVYVSVIDADGHPVTGLTKDQAAVRVDGQVTPLQDVTEVTDVSQPIAAAVLLDTSTTMGYDDKLQNAKAAIKAFGGSLNAQDQVAFYQIAGDGPAGVKRLLNFTTDHAKLNAVVDPLQAGGKAPIYDALYQAAQDMAALPGRKVIVLQTDQHDDSSTHTLVEALALVERVHIPVYTISLGSDADQATNQNIAHDTGGFSFSNPDSTGLADSYQAILSQFRDAYRLIVQTPGAFSVGKHQVQVQITYQNQTYTDPDPGDPNPPSFVVPATALQLRFAPAAHAQVVGTATMTLDIEQDDLPIQRVVVTIDGKPFATLPGPGPNFALPIWNVRFVLPGTHMVHVVATDVQGNTASLDVPLQVGVEWSFWISLLVALLLAVLLIIVLRYASFRFLGGQLEGILVVRPVTADQKAEIELGEQVRGSRLRLRIAPNGVVVGAYPPWKRFPFVAAEPVEDKPPQESLKVTKRGRRVSALLYVEVQKENNGGVKSRLVMRYFRLLKGRNKKPLELSDTWRKKVGNYFVEFTE
jgi:VWFA-related protein